MAVSSRSSKYLSEQEDLEDPPSLRPGAYLSHGDEPAALATKKSLFSLSSFKFSSQKKNETERKYDTALYSFGKQTPPTASTNTLSTSNLQDLNSRLKSFKSSRTLSVNHRNMSFEEREIRNKIPQLFDTHFTYSKADITALFSSYGGNSGSGGGSSDDNLRNMEEGGGNQNPLIQSLKSALKTMSSEIETLEEKCSEVESRYMASTLQASQELQQSMNVIFQYQQQGQKLEDSKSQVQTLKDELKAVKQRLIEKEKERRTFKTQSEEKDLIIKQQSVEITELNKILGESSEDLAQMKIDAKYANTVMVELNACKHKNKSLKDEVIRLRGTLQGVKDSSRSDDTWDRSGEKAVTTTTTGGDGDDDEDDSELCLDSVVVSLDDLYQNMNLEDKKQSYKDVVAERDNLLAAASSQKDVLEALESELAQAHDNLNTTKARLSQLLETRLVHNSNSNAGDGDNVSSEDKDFKIQMAELNSERDQRIQLEIQLANEKRNRLALEAKFASADSDWKELITEVDQEMKASHQTIEVLKTRETSLLEEIERLREDNSKNLAVSVMTSTARELENRLLQSYADTRKAHIMLFDLRATPSFGIRVFVNIMDTADSTATSLIVPQQDHVTLLLKESPEGDEDTPPRRFVFDRVFTSGSHEKLLEGLGEYVQHLIDGKQTSIISYGQSDSNKTALLFGTSSTSGGGAVQGAFNRLIAQLKNLENKDKWGFDVKVTFIRILEEEVLDLFFSRSGGEARKTHEIKRTSGGSTLVTNLETLDVDIRNDREVKSILQRAMVARHDFSGEGVTEEQWRQDCSQSHFVFTVMVTGTNYGEGGRVVEGKLSFVELAGDDGEEDGTARPDSGITSTSSGASVSKLDSGSTSSRAKRSLQCFCDIINAISKRKGHIPYRSTKITYILQPSYSPSGRSLLICGITRDQTHASALRILQFANSVFHCSIAPSISSGTSGGGSNSQLGLLAGNGSSSGSVASSKPSNSVAPGSTPRDVLKSKSKAKSGVLTASSTPKS